MIGNESTSFRCLEHALALHRDLCSASVMQSLMTLDMCCPYVWWSFASTGGWRISALKILWRFCGICASSCFYLSMIITGYWSLLCMSGLFLGFIFLKVHHFHASHVVQKAWTWTIICKWHPRGFASTKRSERRSTLLGRNATRSPRRFVGSGKWGRADSATYGCVLFARQWVFLFFGDICGEKAPKVPFVAILLFHSISLSLRVSGTNVNPIATLLQNFEAALYTVQRFYLSLGWVESCGRFKTLSSQNKHIQLIQHTSTYKVHKANMVVLLQEKTLLYAFVHSWSKSMARMFEWVVKMGDASCPGLNRLTPIPLLKLVLQWLERKI